MECGVCAAELQLNANIEKGELFDCRDCGTEFEVTNTNPLEIDEAPEEEEDWGQ